MDKLSDEHREVYDKLKAAYDVTKQWADGLKSTLFPDGGVDVRRRPTNQGNNFAGYNWARIYPTKDSPEGLAYTVGIDADQTFVVKIDTVQLSEQHPDRIAYAKIRGAYNDTSPIVSTLTRDEGLKLSLDELIAWSVEKIRRFGLTYDDVVERLGLTTISDAQVLAHFEKKPEFKKYRARWNETETKLFCRFVRFVHSQRLDWWHVGRGIQVRYGRREVNAERAVAVIGTLQGKSRRTMSLRRDLGSLTEFRRQAFTEELVAELEEAIESAGRMEGGWHFAAGGREGLWPDELNDEAGVVLLDEDQDEGSQDAAQRGPINRIYYGPPGTGKTLKVTELFREDYEEKLGGTAPEEWRQQTILDKMGAMNWWEAIAAALYALGRTASVTAILEHPFVQAVSIKKGRTQNVRQTLWTTLLTRSAQVGDRTPSGGPAIFGRSGTGEWTLVGDWENVCAGIVETVKQLDKGPVEGAIIQRHKFVTFHQSFGYEEFVEGLRPVLDNDASGEVRYEIKSGVFRDLCDRARKSPTHRFAMIIDEINRGNISKIFGELITLIEVDKREGQKNEVSVVLPYSGETFTVPANVDIIGTMNTADRSLSLLDTALRRRFDFVPLLPNTDVALVGTDVVVNGQTIEIARMLETMNRRIELLYDKDHCIGHAYFTILKDTPDEQRFDELSRIFKHKIVPLLEEYFFDDWRKIRLVLGDHQKRQEAQFVLELPNNDELVSELLGADHGIEALLSRPRHEAQDSAYRLLDAYVGIYSKVV